MNNFIPSTFESLFVTIANLNLTIGVIYSTPDSDKWEFFEYFELVLERLKESNESFALLGDFNINILSYVSDPIAKYFVNAIFENGCIPLITKPTRVTQSSSSCIDNIITNTFFSHLVSGPIIDDISDHFPVFYAFPSSQPNPTNRITFDKVFRDYSKDNIDKLNSNLSTIDWCEVLCDSDPSSASIALKNIIDDEIDKTCPFTTKTCRSKNIPRQPWFSAGLKVSQKKKKKLYKKSLKNVDRAAFYRKYRNLYNLLIKRAKQNYYSERLTNSTHNMKATWTILKEVISKSKSTLSTPNSITVHNENNLSTSLDSTEQIADYFNNYFSSIGERISSHIPDCPNSSPFDFMKNIIPFF